MKKAKGKPLACGVYASIIKFFWAEGKNYSNFLSKYCGIILSSVRLYGLNTDK
jgi:hypothetical protein